MTIKQMEHEIEQGSISENSIEKTKLEIAAAKALANDMYEKLTGLTLNKKLRDFLESKQFLETIYQVIVHSCDTNVDAQKKLRSKDLKPLKNRECSTEQLLEICEKLRDGIRNLLRESEELDYDTLLFQGLFVYYMDVLTSKLGNNV